MFLPWTAVEKWTEIDYTGFSIGWMLKFDIAFLSIVDYYCLVI
jgi:hypothetical protein